MGRARRWLPARPPRLYCPAAARAGVRVAVKLPAATGPAPAAAGRRGHVLQDVEALAKALIVYDLALAQDEQRLDDLLVVRHVHQVLVGRARLLFWYDCVRTNNAGNPHKHCIFVSTSLFRLRLYKNNL